MPVLELQLALSSYNTSAAIKLSASPRSLDGMNATDYLKAALRTEPTDYTSITARISGDNQAGSRVLHAMIGLCTETGELQDAVKKHIIYGKPIDRVNVIEEFSDCLWYIAVGLDACGSSFEEAFAKNIAKLKARFPDKFTEDQALNRDLDAERKALEDDEPSKIGFWEAHDR